MTIVLFFKSTLVIMSFAIYLLIPKFKKFLNSAKKCLEARYMSIFM